MGGVEKELEFAEIRGGEAKQKTELFADVKYGWTPTLPHFRRHSPSPFRRFFISTRRLYRTILLCLN